MTPNGALASHEQIWTERLTDAQRAMGGDAEGEWWTVALLDAQCRAMRTIPLWHGIRCEIPDYQDRWLALLAVARAQGASTLFSLRYHPHRWITDHDVVMRFHWMWETAAAANVPMRQHLHVDLTGAMYPLRMHQPGGDRRGTTRSAAGPSRICSSIAIASWMSIFLQLA